MADETVKEWTVMIYMAGDNNLSADMAYALSDIREVMKDKGDKLNLMVYYDGAAIGAPTFYCDFTDAEKPLFLPSHRVEKIFKVRGKIDDFDENSAAVTPLMNFVNWCVNDTIVRFTNRKGEKVTVTHKGRKANKYALIFSGHASAFQNLSLMMDASSNYHMSIPRLRWALGKITDKTPEAQPLLKQKIDILGFDSCQMGMAELAYEFRNVANILVASEGNLPSAGWTYGSILGELICPVEKGEKVERDEKRIARGFVQQYINKQSDFLIGGVSVDISALDLTEDKPASVIKNLSNLGAALYTATHGSDTDNIEKVKTAIQLTHLDCQSYMFEQNVDIKDFCAILSEKICKFDPENAIITACDELIKAVDDCVLLCGFSGGAYQFSNGISAFFPWTVQSYSASRRCYINLAAANENLNAEKEDQSPLKDWKKFIEGFIFETLRCARTDVRFAPQNANVLPYGYFFPSKENGVANNDEFFTDSVASESSEETKNTHIGNDKNTHIGNDKNTHIGNDKNDDGADDKNTHIGNDKNTHIGNDKNTHIGNDKGDDDDSGKNTHIGNDKNTHIGNDKNTHIGNDKGFQIFLLSQIKNVQSKWFSSGFTKPLEDASSEDAYSKKKPDENQEK